MTDMAQEALAVAERQLKVRNEAGATVSEADFMAGAMSVMSAVWPSVSMPAHWYRAVARGESLFPPTKGAELFVPAFEQSDGTLVMEVARG